MATEPLHAMKACRKCGIEKPHDFETFIPKLGKLTEICRACNAADCKRRYEANREARNADNRARWHKNRDEYLVSQRRYHKENKDKVRASQKAYRDANKDKRRAAHRRWSAANPDRIAEYGRAYSQTSAGRESQRRRNKRYLERHGERIRLDRRQRYYENHEEILAYHKSYYAANRGRFLEQARRWRKENKDKVRAWSHSRRTRDGRQKNFTVQDIGLILEEQDFLCSYCLVEISAYYEADHFIPLAKGGGNEPENIVLACLPCNRSKGAKLPWNWRPELFKPPPT